jgi:hypothetical protein
MNSGEDDEARRERVNDAPEHVISFSIKIYSLRIPIK